MFAPTAETFREFLEQQDFFVFVITIYVGAGLIANDRRANALQIYLSKPLMRTEYIAGKAAVLFAFLLLVTLVPAMLLLLLQVIFAGSFDVPEEEPVPVPGDHRRRAAAGAAGDVHDAGAVVAVEERRYVGILYAGIIFFTAAIYGALWRSPGSTRCRGSRSAPTSRRWSTSIFRLKPRYATPWQVSLMVILGLVASVDLGARTARARRGGGDVSAPIVTAEHVSKWYGQVIGLNDVTVSVPAGHHRPARPERRRQVDVHEADHRSAAAEQGRGQGARRADLAQPAPLLPDRLLPRAGRLLRADDRPRMGHRAGAAERPRARRKPTRRPAAR